MNEDQMRNRKDNGPENLALLRRLALNLAKLEPSKDSMRGKLKRAGWDNHLLAQMLAQFVAPQARYPYPGTLPGRAAVPGALASVAITRYKASQRASPPSTS